MIREKPTSGKVRNGLPAKQVKLENQKVKGNYEYLDNTIEKEDKGADRFAKGGEEEDKEKMKKTPRKNIKMGDSVRLHKEEEWTGQSQMSRTIEKEKRIKRRKGRQGEEKRKDRGKQLKGLSTVQ